MKDIDGEPHVIVPKNIWDRMWDLFNKIEYVFKYTLLH